jgi:hypothetical protein
MDGHPHTPKNKYYGAHFFWSYKDKNSNEDAYQNIYHYARRSQPHAVSHADSHCDANRHRYAYSNLDANCNIYKYGHSHRNEYTDANANEYRDRDSNLYANSDIHTH